jgi:hypothetical protein
VETNPQRTEVEPVARPIERGPKQTLHHVWAPKLRRIVMLTGQGQLDLWAMLEAHPGVSRYCERPASPNAALSVPAADFWALRDGTPVWLRLQDPPADDQASRTLDVCDDGIELISPDELKRHRIWIRNWLSLLPYLSAASPVVLDSLKAQVVEQAGSEATLDDLEQHFAQTDAVLTRTAVVAALHEGLLTSEDLQHRPWDRTIRVCRTSRQVPHAPK